MLINSNAMCVWLGTHFQIEGLKKQQKQEDGTDFKYFRKKEKLIHDHQKANYALIISRLTINEKRPSNRVNWSIGSSLIRTLKLNSNKAHFDVKQLYTVLDTVVSVLEVKLNLSNNS